MKQKKQNGRSTDLTFSWMLLELGKEWETWRKLAEEWISTKTSSIHHTIKSLSHFFYTYLGLTHYYL